MSRHSKRSELHIIVEVSLDRLLEGLPEASWRRESKVASCTQHAGFGWLAKRAGEAWGDAGSAPFAARLSGGQSRPTDFWMWADPLHIEIRRDHGRARIGSDMDCSQEDLDALFGIVAGAARQRDAGLVRGPDPRRWLLRAPRPLDVVCTHPHRLSDADVYTHRPRGPDRRWIEGFLAEVEMAIFQTTTTGGQAPFASANAVWLSGGGVLPQQAATAPKALLVTDSVVARSAWEWAGGRVASGSAWSASLAEDQVVYVDPGLGDAQCNHFLEAWFEGLDALVARGAKSRFSALTIAGNDGIARFVPPKWWSWRRKRG